MDGPLYYFFTTSTTIEVRPLDRPGVNRGGEGGNGTGSPFFPFLNVHDWEEMGYQVPHIFLYLPTVLAEEGRTPSFFGKKRTSPFAKVGHVRPTQAQWHYHRCTLQGSCTKCSKYPCPSVSTTPLWQWGAGNVYLLVPSVQLKVKHCQKTPLP